MKGDKLNNTILLFDGRLCDDWSEVPFKILDIVYGNWKSKLSLRLFSINNNGDLRFCSGYTHLGNCIFGIYRKNEDIIEDVQEYDSLRNINTFKN